MSQGDVFLNRKCGSKNGSIPECTTCRSRFMNCEEIAQERRDSGWNPYWAEEESGTEMRQPQNRWIAEETEEQQSLWGPMMGNDPALDAQRMAERDLRQLQAMYPTAAKTMLPYIEEVCDKMEYDGSMMYDQYPDRVTVYRLAEDIFGKVQEQFPEQCPVKRDEMLAMQYRPADPPQPPRPGQPPQPPRPLPPGQPSYGYNQPGVNWVQDLAQVLLLNEMHHRRRRKKNLFN